MTEDESKVTGAQEGEAAASPEADRRDASDRRAGQDRRQRDVPVEVERRKTPERRQAQRRKRRGPNQYELSADELEFISAIRLFKDTTGRPFPTWSEVLRILRGLGYEKRTD